MDPKNFAIIAIGNILQKDDGLAIFAARYLEENYSFEPVLEIIQGGVEGINLLNTFMEYDEILFLDCIDSADKVGTIYEIPTTELKASGVIQSSAHEIGLMESLGMLELMGEAVPPSTLLAMVPSEIKTEIGLSEPLKENFDLYIRTAIKILSELGFSVRPKEALVTLEEVIQSFRQWQ